MSHVELREVLISFIWPLSRKWANNKELHRGSVHCRTFPILPTWLWYQIDHHIHKIKRLTSNYNWQHSY